MGQIFYASAYDTELRTCCTIDADKFHANCYSFSGPVHLMHHLLRQKPYHIMWGGVDVLDEDYDHIANLTRPEDLLGISTFISDDCFEGYESRPPRKNYHDNVKFICENGKLWKRMAKPDEIKKYCYDREYTYSVKYSGYLVNHTKKLAVDLAAYRERSKFLDEKDAIAVIDPVPVLTETGGGSQMAFLRGVSIETTEELAGEWCGDLLQIVDDVPADYEVINCCFAESDLTAKFFYRTVGVDSEGFVLKNKSGERIKVVGLHPLFWERTVPCYINVQKSENGKTLKVKPVIIEEADTPQSWAI